MVLVRIFIVPVFGSILINHSEAGIASSLVLPLLIMVVVIGMLTQLFNKKKNFNLILTKEGITIKDIYYPWNETYKTYFIIRPRNRSKMYYLVLALDTVLTDKHKITELIFIVSSETKLAAYIDYYKSLPKTRFATMLAVRCNINNISVSNYYRGS